MILWPWAYINTACDSQENLIDVGIYEELNQDMFVRDQT